LIITLPLTSAIFDDTASNIFDYSSIQKLISLLHLKLIIHKQLMHL